MRIARTSGVAFALLGSLFLVACVATPVTTPEDPEIPSDRSSAVPGASDPPSTAGPSEPPVPTTAPGTFAIGDTVTIHTSQGSTWEITPTMALDPADDYIFSGGGLARDGQRVAMLEVDIANVGVITTHPYFDLMFAYQPENAPMYDQNTGIGAFAPNDLGAVQDFEPGDRLTGEVPVGIPIDSAEGSWVISGDDLQSVYRFE